VDEVALAEALTAEEGLEEGRGGERRGGEGRGGGRDIRVFGYSCINVSFCH
jgi:hypothetical protein